MGAADDAREDTAVDIVDIIGGNTHDAAVAGNRLDDANDDAPKDGRPSPDEWGGFNPEDAVGGHAMSDEDEDDAVRSLFIPDYATLY